MSDAPGIAAALASSDGVRITAGGTKAGWGRPVDLPELSVRGLDAVVDHVPGDLTAVLEAGVRLADAQALFAEHRQMLALDPPDAGATVGGIVATADSGPLRHRYGAPRDLVIGIQLALPDGTLARAGGRVIKNVAGYDLAKLSAGAFGTLGVITEVCVRLHPLPEATATLTVADGEPARLAAVALDLHGRPLELDSLDVRWTPAGSGMVLARFAGAAAGARARAVAAGLRGFTTDVLEDGDEALWQAQRDGQRSAERVVLRVAGRPTDLPAVLDVARRLGAPLVGRAGVGTSWLALGDPDEVALVRRTLGRPCVVTDAPAAVRAKLDVWDLPDGPELALMRRVRDRFDPARVCNGELLPT